MKTNPTSLENTQSTNDLIRRVYTSTDPSVLNAVTNRWLQSLRGSPGSLASIIGMYRDEVSAGGPSTGQVYPSLWESPASSPFRAGVGARFSSKIDAISTAAVEARAAVGKSLADARSA